jgi:DHA1 family multidrug resistance protein-like MFS transporter
VTESPRRSWNPLARDNPLTPVYICVFLFNAGEGALHVLVPPYLDERFGLGPAVIGAVVAMFGVASLLARLPVGAIYTVKRARLLLVVGGGLSALAFAVVPLAGGPLPLGGLMALDGIGWSVATTTQLAVLVAARPTGLTTAWAMGWYSGFTGLGHTAAGAFGGFLGDSLGFGPSFLVLAAIPAMATAIMMAAIPDSDRPVMTEEPRGDRRAGAWRHLGRMPAPVWAAVIVMIYINLMNGIVGTFHPVLALGAGLTLTQIGVLASCRSWTSSVTRLGSAPLFARWNGRSLNVPLVLAGAFSLILLPSVIRSFWWQVPLFAAMGLSRGLLRVTASAEAFEGIPDEDREQGLTAALLHAGLDLGKLSGPFVGGLVAQVVGIATMFRVLPAVLVAVYVALEVAASITRRRRSRPVASPVSSGEFP